MSLCKHFSLCPEKINGKGGCSEWIEGVKNYYLRIYLLGFQERTAATELDFNIEEEDKTALIKLSVNSL